MIKKDSKSRKLQTLNEIIFNLNAVKLDVEKEVLNLTYGNFVNEDLQYFLEDLIDLEEQFKQLFNKD